MQCKSIFLLKIFLEKIPIDLIIKKLNRNETNNSYYNIEKQYNTNKWILCAKLLKLLSKTSMVHLDRVSSFNSSVIELYTTKEYKFVHIF